MMAEEEIKKNEPETDSDEVKSAGDSQEDKKPEAEAAEEKTAGDKNADAPEEEKNDDKKETKDDKKESAEEGEQKKEEEEKEESSDEKYMRLMADFQNYKRRTEKEKADVYTYANEKIMTDLLQVLDNFERALANECQDEKYAEGMELIFKQLSDVLTKSGLEEIEAKGKEFDPNFHHAVLTDDNDEFESGQVTEVLQKGYKLNNKVIRPAMVKVNN